jgi:hypothetical protein
MTADLQELLHARIAAKIEAGKAPSKADLAWLEALRERTPPRESVEVSVNAKYDTQHTIQGYREPGETLADAWARVASVSDQAREKYPASRAQLIARQADPTAPTPKGATK